MLRRLASQPLIVLVMGIGAISMLVPAIHAEAIGDHHVGRAFFYSSLLFMIFVTMIAIAVAGRPIRRRERSHLITIVATFTLLPLMLAVPVVEAMGNTTFFNAYVEMVSSLTTTGATLFAPERLAPSVHLWRAQVGWMGGFFVWLTAVAILAPLNLGGFEVRSSASEIGQGASGATPITRVADLSERVTRFALRLFPIYLSLTVLLWALLYITGDTPLVALCHAMSTLATSGISPVGGPIGETAGTGTEILVFIFLIFALSRMTFSADERPEGWRSLPQDRELRIGLLLVVAVPVLLVGRHWLGAFEVTGETSLPEMLRALWGSAFTVLSFLTTTGFESVEWTAAKNWSGLGTPGLILMGLALLGGGVATTAGGVKLLRVHALYQHGLREMEKLVHPSSIGGSGQSARRMRRQGAYVAWIFFMLFAMSIAVATTAFAAAGVAFDESIVLTISALTTTGPLITAAGPEVIDLAAEAPLVRGIYTFAMVVGRLETLAIIALLNPDFWRT
ncbi:MAG: potassium transporter TrkG [Pseudomonadota bacterium]